MSFCGAQLSRGNDAERAGRVSARRDHGRRLQGTGRYDIITLETDLPYERYHRVSYALTMSVFASDSYGGASSMGWGGGVSIGLSAGGGGGGMGGGGMPATCNTTGKGVSPRSRSGTTRPSGRSALGRWGCERRWTR